LTKIVFFSADCYVRFKLMKQLECQTVNHSTAATPFSKLYTGRTMMPWKFPGVTVIIKSTLMYWLLSFVNNYAQKDNTSLCCHYICRKWEDLS